MAKIERNPRVIQYPRSLPLTNFTVDSANINQYDAVQFTDKSSDAVEWYWDFGDGFTSTEQNPVHVYGGGAGSFYTVTLIVKDDKNRVGIAVRESFIEVQNDSYISDKISGIEFIISLYRLHPNANNCIRVREDNNNNEQDFGFVSNDINAELDFSAIQTFLNNNNASRAYVVGHFDQVTDTMVTQENDATFQQTVDFTQKRLPHDGARGHAYSFFTNYDVTQKDNFRLFYIGKPSTISQASTQRTGIVLFNNGLSMVDSNPVNISIGRDFNSASTGLLNAKNTYVPAESFFYNYPNKEGVGNYLQFCDQFVPKPNTVVSVSKWRDYTTKLFRFQNFTPGLPFVSMIFITNNDSYIENKRFLQYCNYTFGTNYHNNTPESLK